MNEGCDFALSVHFNGFNNESANGTEVFVPYKETVANIEVGFKKVLTKYFKERKPFARSNNANNRNETFDKKINVDTKKFDATANKSDYFGFIRTAWSKGLSADLLEICFLTNRKDFDTYIRYKKEIAEGIAKSIVEGFGRTYKAEKQEVVLPEKPTEIEKPAEPEKPNKPEKPKRKLIPGRFNKNRVDVKL